MKKKIKIIQITTSSPSFSVNNYEKEIFNGWYARVAYALKKERPSIDVECWVPEKNYKKEELKYNEGITFRIFPTTLSVRHGMEISLDVLSALKEEIKKSSDNGGELIIHLHEYHSWLAYSILLIAPKSVKIIAQHHGGRSPIGNLLKYPRLLIFSPAILAMWFSERFLFKKIKIFYSLSDVESAYLSSIAKKSEIKFQTMGIDESYFKEGNKVLARKKLHLDGRKKYIIFLGRVKTTKGIKELIDAMKNINAELLVIGEGVDFEKYKNYVEENKLERVKFLGPKYNEEKKSYLDACDLLVLPSYTEGAPVVLMEALAKNRPVVATDVGGIKKMIVDGREGKIIEPKSTEEIVTAVNEVLEWPKKNLKKYAEKYKWKNIILETMRDYEK